MFESRLRHYFSGRQGQRRDITAARSSVYSNRYNCHVLKRTLQAAVTKMQDRQDAYDTEREEQEATKRQKLADVHQCEPTLTDMLDITRLQWPNLKHAPDHGWKDRAQILTKSSTATLVMVNELTAAHAECFAINTDHCTSCGRLKEYETATSLALCTFCGLAERVLNAKADVSNDMLVFRNSRTKRVCANKQYGTCLAVPSWVLWWW